MGHGPEIFNRLIIVFLLLEKKTLTQTPSLRRASFVGVATEAESGFAQAGFPRGARENRDIPLKI